VYARPEVLEGASFNQIEGVGSSTNRLALGDRAVHDWYRFVLAFPPHLVRTYLSGFGLERGRTLLDPFCGTGTTLVEGRKLGCNVVGFEANPMAHLAASVKTCWEVSWTELLAAAEKCEKRARKAIAGARRLRVLPDDVQRLLLRDSICPVPLHKTLILAEAIEAEMGGVLGQIGRVALASTLVLSASNLHFGPEVGVRGRRLDADVVADWIRRIRIIAADIAVLSACAPHGTSMVHRHDSRQPQCELEPQSIDAVFTSPPYPNEKDYTRTTRLESVVLGFLSSKGELRDLKRRLVRSNTRGVYSGDEDECWIAGNQRIEEICAKIEARRVSLGKTSGFERMYHRVVRLYFGGMVRHLSSLRPVLRDGASLGYVVGDQAPYLQVMIRTGEILAELAEGLGYEVCRLDLFRKRFATATRAKIREEVLVLRWPGIR
jgi:hypothetical protein